MAGSINRVTLIGNLGADPESRSFNNGGKVVNLRIATSETWKDKSSGERKEKTEWHSVAIFNEGLANTAERYLRKGSKVYLEGKLQTRKWQDQSGADRYSTEIVLQGFDGTLVMLDGVTSKDAGSDQYRQENGRNQRNSRDVQTGNGGPNNRSGFDRDLDDDVPFVLMLGDW